MSDQKNLHSAKQLQAAIPSNFDVKIKKVGYQVQTAHQSKKQLGGADYYQGAPPNYFMRKGSDNTSISKNQLTPNLTPMDHYQDEINNSAAQQKGAQVMNRTIFEQNGSGTSGTISLAVETRNTMTGTRKKIIKSTVSANLDDRQSDQTQTEMIPMMNANNQQQTITIDYRDGEYSSAHKIPSEFSHRILNPRMGGGYHNDTTSQNSI